MALKLFVKVLKVSVEIPSAVATAVLIARRDFLLDLTFAVELRAKRSVREASGIPLDIRPFAFAQGAQYQSLWVDPILLGKLPSRLRKRLCLWHEGHHPAIGRDAGQNL
jgi:hypothetical protein